MKLLEALLLIAFGGLVLTWEERWMPYAGAFIIACGLIALGRVVPDWRKRKPVEKPE